MAKESRALVVCALMACAGAGVAVASAYVFQDGYADGFDGYYYALQARSILSGGHPITDDASAVLWIIAGTAALTGDPVVAAKLVGLLGAAGTTAGLFLLIRRLTGRIWPAVITSCVWALSWFNAYGAYELVKNSVGNAFLSGMFAVLAGKPASWKGRAVAAVLGLAALACHKMAGGTAALVLTLWTAGEVWRRRGHRTHVMRRTVIAIAVSIAVIAVAVFGFSTLRPVDFSRFLTELDPRQGAARFALILSSNTTVGLKVELLALYGIAPGFAAVLWMRRRLVLTEQMPLLFAMAAAFLLLLLPLSTFDWDSTGYRAMLQSSLFAAAAVGWCPATILPTWSPMAGGSVSRPWRVLTQALSICIVAAMVLSLPDRIRQMHDHQRPDYPRLEKAAQRLLDLLPAGMKVIAHKGFSSFIWYTTGIPADHFVPAETDGYWRVTYAIGPALLEPYLREGDEGAQALDPPYYLVREDVWRRFYDDRKADVPFLSSWMNPNQTRPPYVSYLRGGE